MVDFEFDADLLISLVEARSVLWDRTDDTVIPRLTSDPANEFFG
jgi:hypothetical protein